MWRHSLSIHSRPLRILLLENPVSHSRGPRDLGTQGPGVPGSWSPRVPGTQGIGVPRFRGHGSHFFRIAILQYVYFEVLFLPCQFRQFRQCRCQNRSFTICLFSKFCLFLINFLLTQNSTFYKMHLFPVKECNVIKSVVIVTKIIKYTFNYTIISYWEIWWKWSLSQLKVDGVFFYTPCIIGFIIGFNRW